MTASATRSETVILSADEARALACRVIRRAGYSADESRVIAAHLLDAELCGYPALGLARSLTIAEDPRTREPRTPVAIVHETPVSAQIDGGGYVGVYSLNRAVEVALDKARAKGFAIVGLHNSYFSGRNAYYAEAIARAGYAVIHTASSEPYVAPLGGRACAFGTNPLAIGLPGEPDPYIFDMGTSAITRGEVVLAARLAELLPAGIAIDAAGLPTQDAAAALDGAILPFGGTQAHKGYGLAFMMQAFGLLGGAARNDGRAQHFGFMFMVFDPALLMPAAQFRAQLAELIATVKATPRQPGVDEIRIPSERAFAERARRLREGVTLERRLHERLLALG
jgi:LDH2 family malate/lactate/ureidoglycolate dehydrogenase